MERNKKRVNAFTKGGEKAVGNRRILESLRELNRYNATSQSDSTLRSTLLQRLKPVIETKSVKRAGMSNQVPTPVTERRGRYRAMKWLRESTRKRAKKMGVPMRDARRLELIAIYDEMKAVEVGGVGLKRQTEPMQMRDRTHRAAKANRVFVTGR